MSIGARARGPAEVGLVQALKGLGAVLLVHAGEIHENRVDLDHRGLRFRVCIPRPDVHGWCDDAHGFGVPRGALTREGPNLAPELWHLVRKHRSLGTLEGDRLFEHALQARRGVSLGMHPVSDSLHAVGELPALGNCHLERLEHFGLAVHLQRWVGARGVLRTALSALNGSNERRNDGVLRVFVAQGLVEWSLSPLVLFVHAHAVHTEQEGDCGLRQAGGGDVERSPTEVILDVDVAAVLDEALEVIDITLTRSDAEVASLVELGSKVRAVTDEGIAAEVMAAVDAHVKGRNAKLVLSVGVCPLLHEQLGHGDVPFRRGHVQRHSFVGIRGVHWVLMGDERF
mmetsp:Transcript_17205/g.49931  ORF Transcript_17205/g.49931 Transcript_17205/m.49931 type:complete len:342 (-) Transcript_17205:7003-8028(-)